MKIECKGIFDIHCHIVCGVDDGSKNIEQSGRMLRIGYEEGIRHIIATPHYNKRFWDISKEELMSAYNALANVINKEYDDVTLHLGSEIFYNDNTFEDLEAGRIPTLAGSRYVLVEFMTSISYRQIKNAVTGIQQRDYIPIIAHVERYECLLKEPWLIEELIELGAYIQVNASSVTGENGRTAKKMVKTLLKSGEVHFIASDAHRDDKRAPKLKDAYIYVAKKFGENVARKIFVENPQCIIDNMYIEE